MITTQLHSLFTYALSSLSLPTDRLSFDLPTDITKGDYTTNIALQLAREVKKSPLELGDTLIAHLPVSNLIDKVEVVSPGFINIFIKPSKLLDIGNWKLETDAPERVCVEYTDPNPFKEFHIGHLYSNTVGESLARLQEELGHDVYRLCYQGDVGLHVACSVYGMIEGPKPIADFSRFTLHDLESLPLTDRVKWLGKCYVYGATANKEQPEAAEKIKALNAQVFAIAQEMHKQDTAGFVPQIDYAKFVKSEVYPHDLVYEYYVTGRRWTLDYFEQIYKKLGTNSKRSDAAGAFDHYYFESAVAEYGYTTVQKYLKKGLFEVGEGGAVVSSKEKNGLHTRVFVNALGLPTYEAKELGLNPEKYKKYRFDRSIIVTANEINEYFKVLLWNLKQIDAYVGEHTTHIGHGVVRLPEGKMSSRTGKILSGESLIEEATRRVVEKMNEVTEKDTPSPLQGEGQGEVQQNAEAIAIAAIKYSLLRTNIGRDVIFNFEDSLSFEGDSGPYLLYTIVRCKSILSKVPDSRFQIPDNFQLSILNFELQEELVLIRLLARFAPIVEQAATKLTPHILCGYLHTLASTFSSYYGRTHILKSETEELKNLRLWLVMQIAETLKRGVHILGFEAVEKM